MGDPEYKGEPIVAVQSEQPPLVCSICPQFRYVISYCATDPNRIRRTICPPSNDRGATATAATMGQYQPTNTSSVWIPPKPTTLGFTRPSRWKWCCGRKLHGGFPWTVQQDRRELVYCSWAWVRLLISMQVEKRLLGICSTKSRRRSKNLIKAGEESASCFPPSIIHRVAPDRLDRRALSPLTLVPMMLKAKRGPPQSRSLPTLIQIPIPRFQLLL